MVGAVSVVCACTGFGYMLAHSIKREQKILKEFIAALEFMLCEMNFRFTAMPNLLRLASSVCSGVLCKVFITAANEMDKQLTEDCYDCIKNALNKFPEIPKTTAYCLSTFGKSVGHFDLSGQINCIRAVINEAKNMLDVLSDNMAKRLQCYKTLGISAGIALAIILF